MANAAIVYVVATGDRKKTVSLSTSHLVSRNVSAEELYIGLLPLARSPWLRPRARGRGKIHLYFMVLTR
jgi:hypothetical protein